MLAHTRQWKSDQQAATFNMVRCYVDGSVAALDMGEKELYANVLRRDNLLSYEEAVLSAAIEAMAARAGSDPHHLLAVMKEGVGPEHLLAQQVVVRFSADVSPTDEKTGRKTCPIFPPNIYVLKRGEREFFLLDYLEPHLDTAVQHKRAPIAKMPKSRRLPSVRRLNIWPTGF